MQFSKIYDAMWCFLKKYKSEKQKHGFTAFSNHLFNLSRQKIVCYVLKEQIFVIFGFKVQDCCWFFLPLLVLISRFKSYCIHCQKCFLSEEVEGYYPETISYLSCRSAAAAKSRQLCPALCDPIDGSPPGSPVPGILQARTLEWVAISFSNAWKWKVKVKSLSCVRLFTTPWTAAHQAPPSMGFSRPEFWSGLPLPSLL